MTTSTAEISAAALALLAALAAVAKKLISRKSAKPDYVSGADFRHQMNATRESISALADTVAANHRELVSALDQQATAFEQRIDRLEIFIARLDERTTTNR